MSCGQRRHEDEDSRTACSCLVHGKLCPAIAELAGLREGFRHVDQVRIRAIKAEGSLQNSC